MVKLLPYNSEYSKNYYFLVSFKSPDQNNEEYNVIIYSYIRDAAILGAIIQSCTAYKFTLRSLLKNELPSRTEKWSINQAIQYLQRLRFYKKVTITKQKVVEWEEVIEVEL